MKKKPLTDKSGEVREITKADMKDFKPIQKVDPDMVAAMGAAKRQRGRPRTASPRQMIAFRLPRDVVAGIKSSGRGYNSRVERVLKQALEEGKL